MALKLLGTYSTLRSRFIGLNLLRKMCSCKLWVLSPCQAPPHHLLPGNRTPNCASFTRPPHHVQETRLHMLQHYSKQRRMGLTPGAPWIWEGIGARDALGGYHGSRTEWEEARDEDTCSASQSSIRHSGEEARYPFEDSVDSAPAGDPWECHRKGGRFKGVGAPPSGWCSRNRRIFGYRGEERTKDEGKSWGMALPQVASLACDAICARTSRKSCSPWTVWPR